MSRLHIFIKYIAFIVAFPSIFVSSKFVRCVQAAAFRMLLVRCATTRTISPLQLPLDQPSNVHVLSRVCCDCCDRLQTIQVGNSWGTVTVGKQREEKEQQESDLEWISINSCPLLALSPLISSHLLSTHVDPSPSASFDSRPHFAAALTGRGFACCCFCCCVSICWHMSRDCSVWRRR
jgi:hypothetical protein